MQLKFTTKLGRRLLLSLFLSLLVSAVPKSVEAQGGGITLQVIQPSPPVGTGGPANSVPVLVCPSTATGTPCSPSASVYSDPALTQLLSSPATDTNGNFSGFVSPGYYIVQVSPISGNSLVYNYLVFAGAGTVSSVTLLMPNIFSLNGGAGCTITSAATCNVTLVSQSANTIFAAPNGFAGLPSFRNLMGADLGTQSAYTVLGNCTGSTASPSFCLPVTNMIPSTLNGTAFSGNSSVSGTFGVTGATTLSATLGVTSNATVGGTLGVTGAATFSSTGGFTGAVTSPTVNATTGYEIGGSYGTSGQTLVSTGSGTAFSNSTGQASATITVGSGSGSGATASCYNVGTCYDNGGLITLTTGGSPSGLGALITLAWGASHTVGNCVFAPSSSTAATSFTVTNLLYTGSGFSLLNTGSGLSGSTTYIWSYVCSFH